MRALELKPNIERELRINRRLFRAEFLKKIDGFDLAIERAAAIEQAAQKG